MVSPLAILQHWYSVEYNMYQVLVADSDIKIILNINLLPKRKIKTSIFWAKDLWKLAVNSSYFRTACLDCLISVCPLSWKISCLSWNEPIKRLPLLIPNVIGCRSAWDANERCWLVSFIDKGSSSVVSLRCDHFDQDVKLEEPFVPS